MPIVKGRLRTKGGTASNTAIEPREPASQPYRPKRKVAQRQRPVACALHFPDGQQDQPEHGLGDFMLRQNTLRDLADDREAGAEAVVALRLVKRFKQFGLLDAHKLAGLLLDVPNLDVREDLERRPVPVIKPLSTSCNY